MGLLTSTVGSFPKPAELRRARRRFADEEIEAAALREVEERAVREVLALQEEIGRLRLRMRKSGRWVGALLGVAILTMAVGRYL